MRLETVKVVCADKPRGWRFINKRDFDPDIHTEYVEGAKAPPKPKAKRKPRKKS